MYSKTKPKLVSDEILKNLGKTFKVATVKQTQWEDSIGNFYEDYVRPNLFALIVFGLLIVFLTIRYVLKENNKKKKTKIKKINKKIRYGYSSIADFDVGFTDHEKHEESVYDGSIYPEHMLKDELIENPSSNKLYDIQREYEYNIYNNDGSMSKQMLQDVYQTKTSKFLFDEMSRIVSGK